MSVSVCPPVFSVATSEQSGNDSEGRFCSLLLQMTKKAQAKAVKAKGKAQKPKETKVLPSLVVSPDELKQAQQALADQAELKRARSSMS